MIALQRHEHPVTATTIPHPGHALRAVAALAATWAERRRQRRALLRLDDLMLRDIGLSRSDALGEGDKPFWRA